MKLEQQVCSLDLAKRLKELGVKQESLFYWSDDVIYIHKRRDAKDWYSAFTVAELGEMLPDYIYSQKRFLQSDDWCIYTAGEPKDFPDGKEMIHGNTESDARAKMLVYLIENNLIKP
jgi:hypothetical protein